MQPPSETDRQETYDFNDKNVTGLAEFITGLAPSYSGNKWRLWADFRYQSKQYLNKTDSLYVNGLWETSAGVGYRMNKKLGLSAPVVNFPTKKVPAVPSPLPISSGMPPLTVIIAWQEITSVRLQLNGLHASI